MIAHLLITVWLGVGALIAISASAALLNGGTFELDNLRICTLAAIGINGVIMLGFVAAWSIMRARRPPLHPSLYLRHPILTSGVLLLAALGTLTAISLGREYRGVREVTTTIVLANAYFFALLAVAWSLRLAVIGWRTIKRWAIGSPFRAGLVTMWLVGLAIAGLVLRYQRWYAEPLAWARQEVQLEPVTEADSALTAEQAVLCVGVQELSERVDGAELPGACTARFALAAVSTMAPSSGVDSAEPCFTKLHRELPTIKRRLIAGRRLSQFDADDVAMEALLATCIRVPPPDNLAAYLTTVANNRADRLLSSARRFQCDEISEGMLSCAHYSSPEAREVMLAALWQQAMCALDEPSARVVRERLLEQASFRDVGRKLGLTENKAKDTFHNAIKLLRKRLRDLDCFSQ